MFDPNSYLFENLQKMHESENKRKIKKENIRKSNKRLVIENKRKVVKESKDDEKYNKNLLNKCEKAAKDLDNLFNKVKAKKDKLYNYFLNKEEDEEFVEENFGSLYNRLLLDLSDLSDSSSYYFENEDLIQPYGEWYDQDFESVINDSDNFYENTVLPQYLDDFVWDGMSEQYNMTIDEILNDIFNQLTFLKNGYNKLLNMLIK